jgi:mannosyl-glycoprotein endo-beta-N-acetylglucosaminidase
LPSTRSDRRTNISYDHREDTSNRLFRSRTRSTFGLRSTYLSSTSVGLFCSHSAHSSLSFSHNRVTIPPPSWINAAHRHGVKILGVLYALPNHHVPILINILTSRIFEHNEDAPDLVRLLSGPDCAIEIDPSTPSEYYSFILADLARQRGFDGFLLNFEQSLPGGAKQANALAKWVRHLREELWKKVGLHAEVIWCARSRREFAIRHLSGHVYRYDSVTTTGYVHYQNKLNNWNLPFFLSSTGFFANYFVRNSCNNVDEND